MCLRTCTLAVGSDTFPGFLDKEIIIPKLESLILHRFDTSLDWDAFLRPLVLPSLQLLMVLDARTWNQAAFTSLVVRSTCPLKSLQLPSYDNTTYDLYLLVKELPSLNRLILPWLSIPSSIFEAIHRREILLELEHLECVIDASGFNILLEIFEQCISEKNNAHAPTLGIRSGTLICSDEDGLEDVIIRYHNLRPQLLGNGWDISVCTKTRDGIITAL